jgi:hypothetical protein
MIVKTNIPIIYKCNCPPIKSNFKLTTALPIIRNGKVVGNKIAANTLNYASLNGSPTRPIPAKTPLVKKKKKTKTTFGTKVKKFIGNLKDSGAVDLAKRLIDKKLASNEPDSPPMDMPPPPPTGLSMGAKIGIGVGIAAVLGLGAYLMLKKK